MTRRTSASVMVLDAMPRNTPNLENHIRFKICTNNGKQRVTCMFSPARKCMEWPGNIQNVQLLVEYNSLHY